MKNQIKSKLKFLLFIFLPLGMFAQSTSDNNIAATNKFLGYNGTGANLDFRTNNINRMRLMETGTDIIDLYPVDVSGNLGLSTDPTFFGFKPYSLLHLDGGNVNSPQTQGFRPW